MPGAVNREQALAVLCDLAFTIGAELSLTTLLTRTLQRFMYHTGFPVGFMLTQEIVHAEGGAAEATLDVAVGDYQMVRRQGTLLTLPAALLPAQPRLIEEPPLLAALGTRQPMATALTLPIEGYGHLLLLSPRSPDSGLPLTDLFLPVLSRLSTAITLCQGYERDIQRRIDRRAHYDPLTELPNAGLFAASLKEALHRARRHSRMLAVVYLDVDDFMRLNDRFGQEDGDRLLVAFARRLQQTARPGEVVGHLMADEFVLMLPDLTSREEAEDRLLEIQARQTLPVELDGQPVEIRATLGVALFPTDALDADLLIRHAQMAMHDAKQTARGSYRLFDAEQDRLAHQRRSLLEQAERALADGEFRLHYQPKVEIASGRVIGAEALLRWQHPLRGLRPPGEFLPAIEATDLIVRLGEWVLREAARQAAAWWEQGIDIPISVNIAGRHLQQPDFVARIERVFADVPGARPAMLELEVLETTAIEDFDHAREAMAACREAGIAIALDDFGTGYSSLAYLSQLPATTIKIDQVFVRKLFEQRSEPAIVRAIVQIAEVFGCQVIAEGVETAEHGLILASMGCRYAQGYGVARPMPAADFPVWFRSYRSAPEWVRWRALRWTTDLYELVRARYAHRLWLAQAKQHAGEAAVRPVPNLIKCELSRWLDQPQNAGTAQLHALRTLHGELHARCAWLQAACEAGGGIAPDDFAALATLGDAFVAELDRLIGMQ